MGGMTDDITQGTRLCGWRRSRVSRGGRCLWLPPCELCLSSREPTHDRRRVLWRCWGHSGNGGSKGDRLNRCQSHVGFGVTRRGSGWRVKVPDGYTQGQVREREGGHDGDRIDSGRGSQERYLTQQGNDQEGRLRDG